MAGLFDKQAEIYAHARPTYPKEWFSKLASLTPSHALAWDAGTGNGQAAVAVADYYEQVIATDVSIAQLKFAVPHPKVRYAHTPPSTSTEEMVSLLGGDESVDLVTVATAVHWFDLPSFYSIVNRVLRKPGGVIAVWGYSDISVDPSFDVVFKKFFHGIAAPYWKQNAQLLFDGYRTLPFPFEPVGMGCEGSPMLLDMKKDVSFDGLLGFLQSSSAVEAAKGKGVDLLSKEVVAELESAWGGSTSIRSVTYKAHLLVGTRRLLK